VKWIVLTYTVHHVMLQLPAKRDGNLSAIFKLIAKKRLPNFLVKKTLPLKTLQVVSERV